MPSRPFQPLFGEKREDIGKPTNPPNPPKEQLPRKKVTGSVQPTLPPKRAPQVQLPPKQIPLTHLKDKAANSLGDIAAFIDKRKTLLIIIIIILLLLAVAIVAKRQEQQRKSLKMLRRRLKRLG